MQDKSVSIFQNLKKVVDALVYIDCGVFPSLDEGGVAGGNDRPNLVGQLFD